MAFTIIRLPKDLTGPSRARRSIHAFAITHELDDEAKDAAEMIASELVTNAIVHGDAPIILSISFQAPDLTVEIFDGNSRVESVQLRAADDPQPGGRGLRIVASLADRWGVRPSQNGKTVWAATRSLTAGPDKAHSSDRDSHPGGSPAGAVLKRPVPCAKRH